MVIDYARNPKASTGSFELLYREPTLKETGKVAIELKGVQVRESYFYTPKLQEEKNSFYIPKFYTSIPDKKQLVLKKFAGEIKKILKTLLEAVQTDKQTNK